MNVGILDVAQRALKLFIFWFLFSFYCSDWVISTTLSSRPLVLSSASSNLLLASSGVFFISIIIFYLFVEILTLLFFY